MTQVSIQIKDFHFDMKGTCLWVEYFDTRDAAFARETLNGIVFQVGTHRNHLLVSLKKGKQPCIRLLQ